MKYLALCSALLVSCSLSAQQPVLSHPTSPERPPVLAPDKAAEQKTLEALFAGQGWWAAHRISPGRRISIADAFEPMCATMRTYRVEREDRQSDVTRHAGYSECISISKFRIENAGPEQESADTIILPSE